MNRWKQSSSRWQKGIAHHCEYYNEGAAILYLTYSCVATKGITCTSCNQRKNQVVEGAPTHEEGLTDTVCREHSGDGS